MSKPVKIVIIAIFGVLAMAFIASITYYFVSIRMVPIDEHEYRIMQQAISEGVEFTEEYYHRSIVANGLDHNSTLIGYFSWLFNLISMIFT